ncbi:MAG: LPS export ABC transporter periplasmic protein LptC [Candidatus Omnitrophota bacterium]|nr:LPS export ABC transporter periplasmic protein LptC [Candidatus Omnitrophota bacterium]
MSKRLIRGVFVVIIALISFLSFVFVCFSEEKRQIVVNGDKVEFFTEQKKVIAQGNVVIVFQDTKLTADMVTVFSETNDAVAEGNVRLYSPKGNLEGEKLLYNFNKKTGTIFGAKIQPLASPFFGTGRTIEKLSDQHLEIKRGYLTTCDLEKPHYRLSSRKLEIYPGERIVARDVRFIIGKFPLFYLPTYNQVLNDKRPRVTVMPGYNKVWGYHILQAWRYYFNQDSKGLLHLDYREKKDFAWGVDYSYKTLNIGEGLIRTYYMNERNIQTEHLWKLLLEEPEATTERERFKIQWRHKWEIDRQTEAISQYYRITDNDFVKDYFLREYEKDYNPQTFFLLTRNFSNHALSFRTDARVNRYVSQVERLPEINFNFTSQKIGDSNFYFNDSSVFSNLTNKSASPSEIRQKAYRVHSDNQISYQKKIAFIETKPFVGGRQTYFSRTLTREYTNAIRGMFYTGIDLSTKFYRIFEVNTNYLKLDINRLRHIITPTVSYSYSHRPTVDASKLISFDSVDSLDRQHQVNFALENKIQTKKQGTSVDLLRLIYSTNYLIKRDPEGSRFDHINGDLEITPYKWLTFSADTDYDTRTRKLLTVNFDVLASQGDDWYVGFGRRYSRKSSNLITGEFAYRLNPKWKFRIYQRYESRTDRIREQEYSIIRDLHCWEMDINYNYTPGLGNSIWLVFRIKAFPKMSFEFENRFNARKAGSQSSVEE